MKTACSIHNYRSRLHIILYSCMLTHLFDINQTAGMFHRDKILHILLKLTHTLGYYYILNQKK